jgi:hypothetical protein
LAARKKILGDNRNKFQQEFLVFRGKNALFLIFPPENGISGGI